MRILVLMLTILVLLSCGNEEHEHEAPPPIYVFPKPDQEPPPLKAPPKPGFITLDNIEQTILLDLNSLPNDDARLASRYLVACDRFNLGENLNEFQQGVNRGINMLSTARFIEAVTPIGNADCIYRIDLDDYDITFGTKDSDWVLIEDSMLLDFESLTVRNQNIQFLTQTKKPYVIATDFYVTTFEGDAIASRNCDVYCTIIDQPVDLDDFFAAQGVIVQDEANAERLVFSAFSQSQIALQKDRGVQIFARIHRPRKRHVGYDFRARPQGSRAGSSTPRSGGPQSPAVPQTRHHVGRRTAARGGRTGSRQWP